MAKTGSPLESGFWNHWPHSKVLLFVALGLIFFSAASGLEWATGRLTALALYLFVWNWIANDRRHFPEAASQYQGLALIILWPLLLPIYLMQTRGWRRALVAVAAVASMAVGATLVGAAVPLPG